MPRASRKVIVGADKLIANREQRRILRALTKLLKLFREIRSIPRLTIDLRYRETERNADFFRRFTKDFYRETRKRHPRFPLVRALTFGIAIKELEEDFDAYYMSLDGSARRNDKKAKRLGYTFGRIDFNERLEDIKKVVASTETRQGRAMPERLLRGEIKPNTNPPTETDVHDYPYYGVEAPDGGGLAAYAGCFICGDVCMIETIFGHAEHQSNGVVPMLITGIAADLIENFPTVTHFMYGTVYGASESLQRFKRKMRFQPHRVRWKLG